MLNHISYTQGEPPHNIINNPITAINQRIYELNKIDDEIHLLLHCSPMNNERKILFNSVTATINMQPTNEMFLRIMTSGDITVVKSLAQFIYDCFKQIRVKNTEKIKSQVTCRYRPIIHIIMLS